MSFRSSLVHDRQILLGRVLFALVHLHVLCPIVAMHLTCVFPSLANDMHIVGFASDVLLIFL